MLPNNCKCVWVIVFILTCVIMSVKNERKRVFYFKQVSTIQNFSSRNNVGQPITTNSQSLLSCATHLMHYGAFTCMEFYTLQGKCRSNNEAETVNSLRNYINSGWSFYNVESLGNSAGSLQKSTEECKLDDLGKDYRGKKTTTKTGIECMVWNTTYPHEPWAGTTETLISEEGHDIITTNYCRNPHNDPDGPWCYTMDPSVRWEYCGVPFCQCYT